MTLEIFRSQLKAWKQIVPNHDPKKGKKGMPLSNNMLEKIQKTLIVIGETALNKEDFHPVNCLPLIVEFSDHSFEIFKVTNDNDTYLFPLGDLAYSLPVSHYKKAAQELGDAAEGFSCQILEKKEFWQDLKKMNSRLRKPLIKKLVKTVANLDQTHRNNILQLIFETNCFNFAFFLFKTHPEFIFQDEQLNPEIQKHIESKNGSLYFPDFLIQILSGKELEAFLNTPLEDGTSSVFTIAIFCSCNLDKKLEEDMLYNKIVSIIKKARDENEEGISNPDFFLILSQYIKKFQTLFEDDKKSEEIANLLGRYLPTFTSSFPKLIKKKDLNFRESLARQCVDSHLEHIKNHQGPFKVFSNQNYLNLKCFDLPKNLERELQNKLNTSLYESAISPTKERFISYFKKTGDFLEELSQESSPLSNSQSSFFNHALAEALNIQLEEIPSKHTDCYTLENLLKQDPFTQIACTFKVDQKIHTLLFSYDASLKKFFCLEPLLGIFSAHSFKNLFECSKTLIYRKYVRYNYRISYIFRRYDVNLLYMLHEEQWTGGALLFYKFLLDQEKFKKKNSNQNIRYHPLDLLPSSRKYPYNPETENPYFDFLFFLSFLDFPLLSSENEQEKEDFNKPLKKSLDLDITLPKRSLCFPQKEQEAYFQNLVLSTNFETPQEVPRPETFSENINPFSSKKKTLTNPIDILNSYLPDEENLPNLEMIKKFHSSLLKKKDKKTNSDIDFLYLMSVALRNFNFLEKIRREHPISETPIQKACFYFRQNFFGYIAFETFKQDIEPLNIPITLKKDLIDFLFEIKIYIKEKKDFKILQEHLDNSILKTVPCSALNMIIRKVKENNITLSPATLDRLKIWNSYVIPKQKKRILHDDFSRIKNTFVFKDKKALKNRTEPPNFHFYLLKTF